MKMDAKFTGVTTALVTPFLKGQIDFDSLKRLLRSQMDQGVRGLVVNGTTAESPCLSKPEVKSLFEFVKSEVAGEVPVIVGTGSNDTRATVDFTREVGNWGADAALVVVPYYNRPPQRGMLAHFREVARASSIPVIAYNVPGRTVASLEATTIGEMSREEKIVGIKEATGDLQLLKSIKENVRKEFILLSGDDGSCVEFCARGGDGVISVSSHLIGKDMGVFLERARRGDEQSVREYQDKYGMFMKHLYIEPNPIPVKMALHWAGILTSPELRLPLCALDEKFHKDFKLCLKNLGIL